MKKIMAIGILLLFLANNNISYAWECGEKCPTISFLVQLECEAYHMMCNTDITKLKSDIPDILRALNLDATSITRWGYEIFPILANKIYRLNIHKHKKKLRRLTAWQKKWLGPFLRSWRVNPDSIRIVYDAVLLSDQEIVGKSPISIMNEYVGQTFDNIIYIKKSYKAKNGGLLMLLSHEAYHVKQYKKAGSIANFGQKYVKAFVKAKFSYDNNPMEVAAYKAEARFKKWLCKQPPWRCK